MVVGTTSSRDTVEGQTVFNCQGRPVGVICDGWLVKSGLNPARHMLRKSSGWCTDTEHLSLPIVGIRLHTVTGDCWKARLEVWRRYGTPIQRGYGAQVLLPAWFWTVTRSEALRQLSLFGATP